MDTVIRSANCFLDVYNEEFFNDIDGVTNALDNIKARAYNVSLP
jgi:hypothetical protein